MNRRTDHALSRLSDPSQGRKKGSGKGRDAEERNRVVCLLPSLCWNPSSSLPGCATQGMFPDLSVPHFLIYVRVIIKKIITMITIIVAIITIVGSTDPPPVWLHVYHFT